MNKLAQSFALETAQKLSRMFPIIMIRYEYQECHKTHWIQLLDKEITKSATFVDFYIKTIEEFEKMFQDEELSFITDDTLINLASPSYTYMPIKVHTLSTQRIAVAQTTIKVNVNEKAHTIAA
jgi:hypothetical protein